MQIDVARISLNPHPGSKLRAFASVVLDGWLLVHDIKVVQGKRRLVVAMPSRRPSAGCRSCGQKNHVQARYCNRCGGELEAAWGTRDSRGKARFSVDLAHPITCECRRELEDKVIEAYRRAVEERSGCQA
jgi:DNA-binding cell septation regulator SpoVG